MKKIILRLASVAMALCAIAQSAVAQLEFEDSRYRAEAGVIASQIAKFGAEGRPLYGFRISGQVLTPFRNSQWAIVSGLTLTNKGESSKFYSQEGTYGKWKTSDRNPLALMYLQVPVNISHRFDLNRNNHIYLEFGPYIAYALSGKWGDANLFERVGNERGFNNIELGFGGSLHYDYKNFYLKGGAEISLTPVVNRDGGLAGKLADPKAVSRFGLAYLTFGYQF